jgi:hypothetical protein
MTCFMSDWLNDWFYVWLILCLSDWFYVWLTEWLVLCLIEWLVLCLIDWMTGFYVWLTGRLTQSNAEAENVWSFTTMPPLCFYGAFVRHKDKFNLSELT